MIATAPEQRAVGRDPAALRIIDTDLHHQLMNWEEVAPFADPNFRHRIVKRGGPAMARHGYKPVGAPFGAAPRPPSGAHPASDPAWVKEHYLERYGVDLAILTAQPQMLAIGVQPNPDFAAAIASAYNDWTLHRWLKPYDCFKGSILVAPQDPLKAAAEIDRLGNEPGFVQVLMGSAGEFPFGRRHFHPVYEACVRHSLPLALHIGGEGAGTSMPPTAVGYPSTYYEYYVSLPQSYMAHIMSMITEGVFQKFPGLKVVLYEGGVFWVPHVMWRFDKNWKAQRAETPWVVRPPSEYILGHFYHTTYPLERAPQAKYLHQVLEMIEAPRTLLFSGNFPHWEFGSPFDMVQELPVGLHRRVFVESALEVYGERLLKPNA